MLVFRHELNEGEKLAFDGYLANHTSRALSLNCQPEQLLARLEAHPHSSKLAWLLFDMQRVDPSMRPRRRSCSTSLKLC